jgi:hypothetical protein
MIILVVVVVVVVVVVPSDFLRLIVGFDKQDQPIFAIWFGCRLTLHLILLASAKPYAER